MNDTPRRLVRPRFLKISLLVFVLLIPFVVHSACDYSESRRLARTIAQIRAAREPISVYEIDGYARNLAGPPADAARYYRAAAALASVNYKEMLPQQTIDESLRFLDRAARLEFQGFPTSFDSSYRVGELANLSRLVRERTQQRLESGDIAGARASFYSQLRLAAVVGPNFLLLGRLSDMSSMLAGILADRRFDSRSLEPIAAALRDLDRDDVLRQQLVRQRAMILDSVEMNTRSAGFLMRPVALRFINIRLAILQTLIDQVSAPWPRPLDAPKAVDYSPMQLFSWLGRSPSNPRPGAAPTPRDADEERFAITARNLAMVRCARAAVAATRARDETGQIPSRVDDLVPRHLESAPIDPFSGTPIQMVSDGGALRVFSAGKERNGRPIEIQIPLR